MIVFANPWLLVALAVLPVLWWLVRATPPAPRVQSFPAVTLLLGLATPQTVPDRTPWWLLALRLAAAALVIVGLAGPVRRSTPPATAVTPLVLVVDNGWAAAADWADRMRAAADAVAGLLAPDATLHLLTTAPGFADAAATSGTGAGPALAARDLPALLAALRPLPWSTSRAATAAALAALPANSRVIYVADGLAGPDPAQDARFAASMRRLSQITELRGAAPVLLRPPKAAPLSLGPASLSLRIEALAAAAPVDLRVTDAAGHVLAAMPIAIQAGTTTPTVPLPPDLRNRAAALRIAGPGTAGGVLLLDEAAHRRPVGLLGRGGANPAATEAPLTSPLFYVRRALTDRADLREGNATSLLAGGVSVIIDADEPVDPDSATRLAAWVRHGGVLVRFAGPTLAAASASPDPANPGATDPLLPETLLAGDRSLGGAMSWTRPAALAAFPAGSPFASLPVPPDVRIARQVLAPPAAPDAGPGGQQDRQDWADLADGTPLVTARRLGAGELVLFHVTANAAWSNLPLSGLFPQMLQRLVALSVGIRAPTPNGSLAPLQALDGFGTLGPPGPQAAALPAQAIASGTVQASPLHPPGLYGPADGPSAFSLGTALPPLAAMSPLPGATLRGLAAAPAPHPYGPALITASLLLLSFDLLLALRLRGLIQPATRHAAILLLLATLGTTTAHAAPPPMPSLATHLAYVVTGDPQADGVAQAGLRGLSQLVNQRTAAVLDDPVGVDPARDDLSFYPLLYWPILSSAAAPDGNTAARLDAYMDDGGIILFDTRDAGGNVGAPPDADGAQAALRRIGTALLIPPLTRLTSAHVLSRSFYLLHAWPGRLDGDAVWVARDAERANDGVSPVIVGGNDWASAWAVNDAGDPQYDVTPGGEAQRTLADRFGINLVIYALTGNYKADQLHVPELLRRLGQDPGAPDASPTQVPPAPP